MAHIDLGITGAKRQSWRNSNPRELLRRICEQHPHASHDDLFKWFRDALAKAGDQMQTSVDRYYFDNNIRSLEPRDITADRERKAESRRHREEQQTKAEANIKAAIHAKVERLLLEAIMPNGKALRDCTGRECRQMGGWLAGIGEALKPDQIVADKFSEEQIQSHWNRKVK